MHLWSSTLSESLPISSFQISYWLNNKNSKTEFSTAHGYAKGDLLLGTSFYDSTEKKWLMLMTLTTSKINSWVSENNWISSLYN